MDSLLEANVKEETIAIFCTCSETLVVNMKAEKKRKQKNVILNETEEMTEEMIEMIEDVVIHEEIDMMTEGTEEMIEGMTVEMTEGIMIGMDQLSLPVFHLVWIDF